MSGGGKQWRERQYDSGLLKVIVSHKHVQVSNVELQLKGGAWAIHRNHTEAQKALACCSPGMTPDTRTQALLSKARHHSL